MNLRKKFKKHITYKDARYFFNVISDGDVINNRMPVSIIVVFALIGLLGFFVSGEFGTNVVAEIILYFSIFPILLIYNWLLKRNVKKYRKFIKLYALINLFVLEYALLKICSLGLIQWKMLLIIGVLSWLLQTSFLIVALNKVRKTDKKHREKKNYERRIYAVQGSLVAVGLISAISQRRYKLENINSGLVTMGIHVIFSIVWVNILNSVIFEIIYREEIASELEKQREALEEKKANRRKLKRK